VHQTVKPAAKWSVRPRVRTFLVCFLQVHSLDVDTAVARRVLCAGRRYVAGRQQRPHRGAAAAAAVPASAGNCCLEPLRERLASPSWSHMASAPRPRVPGERDRARAGAGRKAAAAMSVSFDAIRTERDAIWRPIAALRPTRCRRRPNSTRITQQLGRYIGP